MVGGWPLAKLAFAGKHYPPPPHTHTHTTCRLYTYTLVHLRTCTPIAKHAKPQSHQHTNTHTQTRKHTNKQAHKQTQTNNQANKNHKVTLTYTHTHTPRDLTSFRPFKGMSVINSPGSSVAMHVAVIPVTHQFSPSRSTRRLIDWAPCSSQGGADPVGRIGSAKPFVKGVSGPTNWDPKPKHHYWNGLK